MHVDIVTTSTGVQVRTAHTAGFLRIEPDVIHGTFVSKHSLGIIQIDTFSTRTTVQIALATLKMTITVIWSKVPCDAILLYHIRDIPGICRYNTEIGDVFTIR